MTQILAFLAAHMGFLWRDARFRIVDSEVTTSNGGDALLVIESRGLRLRFVCDRQQLMLDLQPTVTPTPTEWFSVDLVRRLLRGAPERSALLDASYAEFLEEHLAEVERRFDPSRWPETRTDLKKLRVLRAKELSG